ncbi:MAG: hypothetical protein HY796_08315 [Elusimicrobia bacterium]|nr:hypothetical protein [Elusimicrobiota bacterium]
MEEGLIKPADDSDNLNIEIDKLFHNLTGKEENSIARIRMLEAELDKKRMEMDAVTTGFEARENQFKERESKLKEIADKDQEETTVFYDRILKDFGDKEKKLLLGIKELKEELIAGNSENEKLRNEVQELKSRLNQALETCAEEQNKGKERDIFAQSARSALKDKEQETARIWHILEETKLELSREKAKITAKDTAIENLQKVKQNLELETSKLSVALRQGEQGFYDKAELLKKELKEKERLGYEFERKLGVAEKRLNEALEEAVAREKILSALRREQEETQACLMEFEGKSRELEQELQIMVSKAQKSGAEQKLDGLLEARDEINKNLTRKIKSLEEALSAVHGEYAGLLKAAEDEKTGVLVELKRSEEETAAVRDRQRSLEHELGDTAEKWPRQGQCH